MEASLTPIGNIAAAVLRETLAVDPVAVEHLIATRVLCLPGVETDSPAVPFDGPDNVLLLGPLGLINGIVNRIDPGGRVVAHYDEDNRLTDFTYERLQYG